MKRTTRPDGLAVIIAARAAAVSAAMAQPKRKRAHVKRNKTEPVPRVAAPPIERRGEQQLARLGQAMRLEPEVTRRREELADLASLMRSQPRGR